MLPRWEKEERVAKRVSVCLCNAKRDSTRRNHVCNPTVDCISLTSSLDIAVSQYRENRIYVSMGDSHLRRRHTKKREKTRTVVAQGRARSSRYRSWDVSIKLGCQTVSSSPGSNEPVKRSGKFNSEPDPFPFSPSFLSPFSLRVLCPIENLIFGYVVRPAETLKSRSRLPCGLVLQFVLSAFYLSFDAFYLSSWFVFFVPNQYRSVVMDILRTLSLSQLNKRIGAGKN